ncbi:hypothetical protein [Psychrobacter sp.]|uniref:hypothetical protein n=1 Tax=Psychrobacter sp. TaxID=56811 RepID=UPI003BAF387F
MTQYKPFIFINRLIITKGKHTVYDEFFHKGVNIIRGTNSSGKSTIMEFLFYGLGGSILEKQWKTVALSCDNTHIEVDINNQVFVLKRQVSTNFKEQMNIFEGTYDESVNSSAQNWLSFPYASTANKESFHDNLLKLLNIPITKSQDSSYINFNQILRLIYTDQLSGISRIFREEDFDSSFKRETIGDLMLGVNSKDVTQKKLEIIQLNKDIDKLTSDIRAFTTMYGEVESESNINERISENKVAIETLTSSLYSVNTVENESVDESTKELISSKREQLNTSLQTKENLLRDINTLNFEIIDSESFVVNLKKRLINIQESDNTLSILSDIAFNFCPSCFSKVSDNLKEVGACNLCHSSNNDSYESPTFRVRKDIEFQISETKDLIPKFNEDLEKLTGSYVLIKEEISNLKSEILILEKPIKGISSEKTGILINIGELRQRGSELAEKSRVLNNLYAKQANRDSLQNILNSLENEVLSKESSVISNRNNRKTLISAIALRLLLKDLDREDDFKDPKEISFDFTNDRIKVDGVSNFSASSTSILKTVLKLSILIASCEDPGFLYPRLAIMDNVEDKGMEQARSQNLQKIIIEESNNLEVEHQIIFTTSMIDESLEGSKYCIGEFYNPESRTLDIKGY